MRYLSLFATSLCGLLLWGTLWATFGATLQSNLGAMPLANFGAMSLANFGAMPLAEAAEIPPSAVQPAVPATAQPHPDAPWVQEEAWKRLAPLSSQFSLPWQRRYQELRSMYEDVNTLDQQIIPLLYDLHAVLLETQGRATFLLLDLIPAKNDAQESSHLTHALQEWLWHLELPYKNLHTTSDAVDFYSRILHEMGEALQLSLKAPQQNSAMEKAADDIQRIHASLSIRVAQFQERIQNLRRPASQLLDQMRQEIDSTSALLPFLWAQYYLTPHRLTKLSWWHSLPEFRDMYTNLLQTDLFPAQSVIILLLNGLIVSLFGLFFYMLHQSLTPPSPPSPQEGLPWLIGTALNMLSPWRKLSLVVITLCSVNILLDALPFVYMHVPFLGLQYPLLIMAVAPWAASHSKASRLHMLIVPVLAGLLALHGDASPLWMIVLLGGALVLCILSMLRRPQAERSLSYTLWLGALMLSALAVLMGFGRMVVPLLILSFFAKAAVSTLLSICQSQALRTHPLGFPLLMPLLTVLLCALVLIGTMICPGIPSLLGHWQANDLHFFGLNLRLRDIVLLLALIWGLLAFEGVSRRFLARLSQTRALLDTSAVPVIHTVVNCVLWVLFGLFAMGLMGGDIRSLAFIGGGLTVGLGFGLQHIISNFFSGLVLIFAKVVRGGDLIEVGSIKGNVRSVNMRATVVETSDNAILLIPNMEMLNTRILNWTRNNRRVCEDLPVRVAPSTHSAEVIAALESTATGHPGTLLSPPPKAFFVDFGEGSLNFILQVWISDVSHKRAILSALRCKIQDNFQQQGIQLALPHMDVSMSELNKKKLINSPLITKSLREP